MSAKRSIMRIQLDTAAKDRLETICKRRGMTQIALMSRLVNWFSYQDDYVQTAVLATLSDESMASLAKSLLKKIMSSSKASGG
ncbi:MAG TPA: hypothetical protein VL992_14405 [Tepidisphaeraceae bacterium]|nr:hypothetical protein [Tepidisphaeraceae bacterium]HUB26614.1 hypothetical protein [Tepidisphaeraceae bacterium]